MSRSLMDRKKARAYVRTVLSVQYLFLREESLGNDICLPILQDEYDDMRYSASNSLRRKFHFSALRHGDDGVVGRVVVCG
jgi:hypothetical protein